MSSVAEEPQEPKLYQLFRTLFHEAETLVMQKVAPMRVEVAESTDRLVKGSAILLVGMEIAVAGIVILIAAVIALVSQTKPVWLRVRAGRRRDPCRGGRPDLVGSALDRQRPYRAPARLERASRDRFRGRG
jgi:hypothetical protein